MRNMNLTLTLGGHIFPMSGLGQKATKPKRTLDGCFARKSRRNL